MQVSFSKPAMKRNYRRLRSFFSRQRPWVRVLRSIAHWDRPIVSMAAFIVLWWSCFAASAWMYPLMFATAVTLVGYLARDVDRRIPGCIDYSVKLWHDQVEPPNHNLVKKYYRYKNVAVQTQVILGKLASWLERSSNVFTWTEPRLTAKAVRSYSSILDYVVERRK